MHRICAAASGPDSRWLPALVFAVVAFGSAAVHAQSAEPESPPGHPSDVTAPEVVDEDAGSAPMPSISVGITYYPPADLSDSDDDVLGQLSVSSFRVNVGQALSFGESRTRLDLGAGYRRLQFNATGFDPHLTSVHAISLSITLRQKLTDAWGVLLLVEPTFADDFKGDLDDEQFGDSLNGTLGAAATYAFSPRLEVGAGVAA